MAALSGPALVFAPYGSPFRAPTHPHERHAGAAGREEGREAEGHILRCRLDGVAADEQTQNNLIYIA